MDLTTLLIGIALGIAVSAIFYLVTQKAPVDASEPVITVPLREVNVDELEIGQSGYTVPWAASLLECGAMILNPTFTVGPKPFGTASMLVTRRQDGFHLTMLPYFDKGPYRWHVQREDAGTGLPVTSFRYDPSVGPCVSDQAMYLLPARQYEDYPFVTGDDIVYTNERMPATEAEKLLYRLYLDQVEPDFTVHPRIEREEGKAFLVQPDGTRSHPTGGEILIFNRWTGHGDAPAEKEITVGTADSGDTPS